MSALTIGQPNLPPMAGIAPQPRILRGQAGGFQRELQANLAMFSGRPEGALADGKEVPSADGPQARQAAQDFVATALINPLLEQLQNEPFQTNMFHGGFAEDAYRQRLNAIYADRITASTNFDIVDVVHQHITGTGRFQRDHQESQI